MSEWHRCSLDPVLADAVRVQHQQRPQPATASHDIEDLVVVQRHTFVETQIQSSLRMGSVAQCLCTMNPHPVLTPRASNLRWAGARCKTRERARPASPSAGAASTWTPASAWRLPCAPPARLHAPRPGPLSAPPSPAEHATRSTMHQKCSLRARGCSEQSLCRCKQSIPTATIVWWQAKHTRHLSWVMTSTKPDRAS